MTNINIYFISLLGMCKSPLTRIISSAQIILLRIVCGLNLKSPAALIAMRTWEGYTFWLVYGRTESVIARGLVRK